MENMNHLNQSAYWNMPTHYEYKKSIETIESRTTKYALFVVGIFTIMSMFVC
jgi:hypothetical protein